MKKISFIIFSVLILFSSINNVNAKTYSIWELAWELQKEYSFFDDDNIFEKIDSWEMQIQEAMIEVNLKWNDKDWKIDDALAEFSYGMWMQAEFKWATAKKLKQIYEEKWDYLKVLASMVNLENRETLTQEELHKLSQIVKWYYKISKQEWEKQNEQLFKLSNIWVYSDWNTNNSPFDLIEDLDDINALLYWEEDPYDPDDMEKWWTADWVYDLLNNNTEDPSKYEADKNSRSSNLSVTQANVWQNVELNPQTKQAIELALWNIWIVTLDEFRANFLKMLNDINMEPEIRDWIMDLLDNVISVAKLKENIENILKWLWVNSDIINEVLDVVDKTPDLNEMKNLVVNILKTTWVQNEIIVQVEEIFENIWIPYDVIDAIDRMLKNAWISQAARDNLRKYLESFSVNKTLEQQADYVWWKLRCAIDNSWLSIEALWVLENPANRNHETDNWFDDMLKDMNPEIHLSSGSWMSQSNWWVTAETWTWVYVPFSEEFPCSPDDVFCVLVKMKMYTQNMIWEYKSDKLWTSLSAIVSTYNENFRDWAYSRLAQKKMTINNFEFGYPLDLADIFSNSLLIYYQPMPLYNVRREEEWKTTSFPKDLVEKDRIIKNSFDAYWLDYYNPNNLALAEKELYKKTNLWNSSSGKISKTWKQDYKAKDLLDNQQNELIKIELQIEKMMSEQNDFTDFNTSFVQMKWIFDWMKSFAKNLRAIANRMKQIQYK